jgi:ribosomal protein S18 acetylase RimI-like enzyme
VSVAYREARASDAPAIAGLHAASWRRNYRGAFADAYLDGDIDAERLAHWSGRLAEAAPAQRTFVAHDGPLLVGFVHVVLRDDPRWGALLDNLHVDAAHARRGIGAALMALAGGAVAQDAPAGGLYLWVLEQNLAAQRFYARIGGKPAGRESAHHDPGRLVGEPSVLRYAWRDAATLVSAATPPPPPRRR